MKKRFLLICAAFVVVASVFAIILAKTGKFNFKADVYDFVNTTAYRWPADSKFTDFTLNKTAIDSTGSSITLAKENTEQRPNIPTTTIAAEATIVDQSSVSVSLSQAAVDKINYARTNNKIFWLGFRAKDESNAKYGFDDYSLTVNGSTVVTPGFNSDTHPVGSNCGEGVWIKESTTSTYETILATPQNTTDNSYHNIRFGYDPNGWTTWKQGVPNRPATFRSYIPFDVDNMSNIVDSVQFSFSPLAAGWAEQRGIGNTFETIVFTEDLDPFAANGWSCASLDAITAAYRAMDNPAPISGQTPVNGTAMTTTYAKTGTAILENFVLPGLKEYATISSATYSVVPNGGTASVKFSKGDGNWVRAEEIRLLGRVNKLSVKVELAAGTDTTLAPVLSDISLSYTLVSPISPNAPAVVPPVSNKVTTLTPTLNLPDGDFNDIDGGGWLSTRWQIATDAAFTNIVEDVTNTDSATMYSHTAGAPLIDKTEYFWRAAYLDSDGDANNENPDTLKWSATTSFNISSSSFTPPTVKLTVDNITATSANVVGEITDNGGAPIIGVCLMGGIKQENEASDTQAYPLGNCVDSADYQTTFSSLRGYTFSNLEPNKTYVFIASADNDKATWGYSEQVTITTLSEPSKALDPVVTTLVPIQLTTTSYLPRGNFVAGSKPVKGFSFFCTTSLFGPYSEITTYEYAQDTTGIPEGDFAKYPGIENLEPGIKYWIQARVYTATTSPNRAYDEFDGDWLPFTVPANPNGSSLSVTTLPPTEITATSILPHGSFTHGIRTIDSRGFEYCTDTTDASTCKRSWDNNMADVQFPPGEFTKSPGISELKPSTNYYIRAQVWHQGSSEPTFFGEWVAFTTLAASGKTDLQVSTLEPTNVTASTAVISGEITKVGDKLAISRGIMLSESQSEDYGGNYMGSWGTGVFHRDTSDRGVLEEGTVTNLKPNTTYWVRAWACEENLYTSAGKISDKVALGDWISFRTNREYKIEVVTLEPNFGVSLTSKIPRGNIVDTGGEKIIRRGFKYGTDPNRMTSETSDSDENGYGTGTFSKFPGFENLSPDTTYYYAAFVEFRQGIFYPKMVGNPVSFRTHDGSIPIITTERPDNIKPTSALFQLSIIDVNGSSAERGFQYGISNERDHPSQKIISEIITKDMSKRGRFSIPTGLNDLRSGTNYWVRAWVSQSIGGNKIYGDWVQFTTDFLPDTTKSTPKVSVNVKNITATSADIIGNVTATSSRIIRLCMSVSNAGSACKNVSTGIGEYYRPYLTTPTWTGLSPNTQYTVYTDAENLNGYGSAQFTFTTKKEVYEFDVYTNTADATGADDVIFSGKAVSTDPESQIAMYGFQVGLADSSQYILLRGFNSETRNKYDKNTGWFEIKSKQDNYSEKTIYRVRAVADINGNFTDKTAYGEWKYFSLNRWKNSATGNIEATIVTPGPTSPALTPAPAITNSVPITLEGEATSSEPIPEPVADAPTGATNAEQANTVELKSDNVFIQAYINVINYLKDIIATLLGK